MYLSDLKAGKYKADVLKKIIKNNHIRFVVDIKFADADVDTLRLKLNMLSPSTLRVEYELPNDGFDSNLKDDIEHLNINVTLQNVLQEYVEALEVPVSKKDVFAKCLEYYSLYQ